MMTADTCYHLVLWSVVANSGYVYVDANDQNRRRIRLKKLYVNMSIRKFDSRSDLLASLSTPISDPAILVGVNLAPLCMCATSLPPAPKGREIKHEPHKE